MTERREIIAPCPFPLLTHIIHAAMRLIKRLALIAGSVALSCLLLEGMLRAYFALTRRDIRNYQPSFLYSRTTEERARFTEHPFLPYAPRPFDSRKIYIHRPAINQTIEYDAVNNSLGFRSPERPFDKPPNVKRIITLGGSTTWDGPTNMETWPALLEKKLNDAGYKVEVINMGVDMAASPMSLINLVFIGIEFQPDLIISYDGVNDTTLAGYEGISPDYRNIISRYDPDIKGVGQRLPPWLFRSYLISVTSQKIDTLLKQSNLYTQVYRNELPRSSNEIEGARLYERNLKTMRGIAKEHGAGFLAATAHWTQPSEKVNQVNDDLRTFFEREQIDYLDLDRLLPHDDYSIHVDEFHWTRAGLDLVAEKYKERIVQGNLLGR